MLNDFYEFDRFQMYNDFNGTIIDFAITVFDYEYLVVVKDFDKICRLSIYDFSYLNLGGDESLILSNEDWKLVKKVVIEKWSDARKYAHEIYHEAGFFENHPKRNLILPEVLNLPNKIN